MTYMGVPSKRTRPGPDYRDVQIAQMSAPFVPKSATAAPTIIPDKPTPPSVFAGDERFGDAWRRTRGPQINAIQLMLRELLRAHALTGKTSIVVPLLATICVQHDGTQKRFGKILPENMEEFLRRCHDPLFANLVARVARQVFKVDARVHEFQLYEGNAFVIDLFNATVVPTKDRVLPALILGPVEHDDK